MDWCVKQQLFMSLPLEGQETTSVPVLCGERVPVQPPLLHMLNDARRDALRIVLDQCHPFVFLFEMNWEKKVAL